MNWDIEFKRIESEVQTLIDTTIEDTRKKFNYCQEEQQLQEVLKVICATLPHYPNKYNKKDFHTLGTKANIETRFIFFSAKVYLEKKNEYIPDKYAEVLCTKDIPLLIENFSHFFDKSIDLTFLKLKYNGGKGILKLIENCISCTLHSNQLYGKPFENFLPTEMGSTNTNYLRKHLGLPTYNHGKANDAILKFNIGLNHKIKKAENFFLIFDILYEFQMFKDENNNVPSKQDYFEALDSIFTLPHHERFSNTIFQAKSKKDQELVVAIFESMLAKAKEKYLS